MRKIADLPPEVRVRAQAAMDGLRTRLAAKKRENK
jgi:hypothetical protein